MVEELKKYVDFIREFENSLTSEFDINGNIWNRSGKDFPKSGKVKDYQYKFHGAGCEVIKNDIICEYDIAPLNGRDIKFSPWKFSKFIESHPDLNIINRHDLELGLLFLVNEKKISKLIIDGIETGVYEVIPSSVIGPDSADL
ncbi:DUF6896 domain-containing protein [Aquimarina spinulae]|uniref:DUF6896 domain-containing protein n=1 Tax=Aquimarina spinulae TaxID=1192023 RepID=UPI000D55EA43|nr:hypothetical protein [Aquimarina spinulae]